MRILDVLEATWQRVGRLVTLMSTYIKAEFINRFMLITPIQTIEASIAYQLQMQSLIRTRKREKKLISSICCFHFSSPSTTNDSDGELQRFYQFVTARFILQFSSKRRQDPTSSYSLAANKLRTEN